MLWPSNMAITMALGTVAVRLFYIIGKGQFKMSNETNNKETEKGEYVSKTELIEFENAVLTKVEEIIKKYISNK